MYMIVCFVIMNYEQKRLPCKTSTFCNIGDGFATQTKKNVLNWNLKLLNT